jgi:hypothetical protein
MAAALARAPLRHVHLLRQRACGLSTYATYSDFPKKKPETLEELVEAVKDPSLIPRQAVSKYIWLDKAREFVQKQQAWERACVPLTPEDKPVHPLNKYLYNIQVGIDMI